MAETRNTLVSNSDLAKGMPDRAQALQNVCCSLPPNLQKDRSNILLKQSVTM